MKHRIAVGILLLAWAAAQAQFIGERRPQETEQPMRLPNGKLQSEEIIKADFKKTVEDADELVRLSQEVKTDLEKSTAHVLSMATLKKLDEIDKVTRRMRNRMKR